MSVHVTELPSLQSATLGAQRCPDRTRLSKASTVLVRVFFGAFKANCVTTFDLAACLLVCYPCCQKYSAQLSNSGLNLARLVGTLLPES